MTELEEEKVTSRVIVEQAARIISVIAFLAVLLMPLIICDALGSVAPTFSEETGIPLNVAGDSQTKFTWGTIYLLQNSGDEFLPFQVFKTGAQWITSSTGTGAMIFAVAGQACMILAYIVPVYLFAVLKISRYFEGTPIDQIKKVSMPVCAFLNLLITGVMAGYVIGYWWNFFWEYDIHYDFASQFFMAYGGVKMAIVMVLSLILAILCIILTVFDRKKVE